MLTFMGWAFKLYIINISYSRAASSDTLTLGTNAPKQSVRTLALQWTMEFKFKMQGSLASSSSEVSTTVKEPPDKHDQANSNLQTSV